MVIAIPVIQCIYSLFKHHNIALLLKPGQPYLCTEGAKYASRSTLLETWALWHVNNVSRLFFNLLLVRLHGNTSLSAHCFRANWNSSTTTGSVAFKFYRDIPGPERMNPASASFQYEVSTVGPESSSQSRGFFRKNQLCWPVKPREACSNVYQEVHNTDIIHFMMSSIGLRTSSEDMSLTVWLFDLFCLVLDVNVFE